MEKANIEKIAQNSEDRMLLAKLWDKIHSGLRRSIPANTGFLSPRELELSRFLFGDLEGLHAFGGCEDAERKMLCYLPDYLEPSWLLEDTSPVTCLHATFYEGDTLTHRDILGALMGAGVSRDAVGDIYVGKGCCDVLVTSVIAPYLLDSFTSAGRVKLKLSHIPLSQLTPPQPEVVQIRDTVASLRLDSAISSGFRISRGLAAQYVTSGRAAIDGLPCEKPDRTVEEGMKISVRGLGKIKIHSVNGQTKKGRISVLIHRYV